MFRGNINDTLSCNYFFFIAVIHVIRNHVSVNVHICELCYSVGAIAVWDNLASLFPWDNAHDHIAEVDIFKLSCITGATLFPMTPNTEPGS